nr:hypothetical protein [Tanacetum cinerariifolium]
VPTVELVSPPKGIEPVIPPPSTEITTTGARITVRLQASIYLPPKAEVERFLAIPTAALPSLPLPPPLSIPPLVDRKDDIPQTELPPHKKSCLFALGPMYEVGESSTARPTRGRGIDYGFVSTLDAKAVHYELQTHREQVYKHDCQIQAHQTQLQPQGTLIQTHHQVKFATCTLLGDALTWWNGNDVPTYTDRFQELTLICTKFVANETEKIDKYISGLFDNIYGSVKASKPKTLDETIELANDLMDQKIRTYAERQTGNKKKADDSSRNNHGHQQHPSKR